MTAPAPTSDSQPDRIVTAIAEDLRERVLRPYLPVSRYVRRARLARPQSPGVPRSNAPESWLRLDADCAIQAPCYIESTGHFNAVELNITYNQMLYLCLAESMRLGLFGEPAWTLEQFFQAQLPNVLITDYQAKFRRPMTSAKFTSWFMLESVQVNPQRNMATLKTRCAASNGGVDANEAHVTVALVDWPTT